MTIAYLGPEATNTHAAALKCFGPGETYQPCTTIAQVFDAVLAGGARSGVVPVENAIQGVVRETIDCLLESPLLITQEVELDIIHALMGPPGLTLKSARSVASHPQALAQCRLWLARHAPHLENRITTSTSAAARETRGGSDTLAIAPPLAAQIYDLHVLAPQISDRTHNATRFVCIAPEPAAPTGRDRTSLVFTTPHEQGALRRILGVFDDRGVNMTRIESRPLTDRRWEYAFVVDVEGHRSDPAVAAVLADLARDAHLVKVLGSYPRADDLGASA